MVDNCGSHGTKEVQTDFSNAGWVLRFLPPNMTGKLQPMDLVVNAVCKAALRRVRINYTLEYFSVWKDQRRLAERENKPLPPFNPPKPSIVSGVSAMLDLMHNKFVEESFVNSLK